MQELDPEFFLKVFVGAAGTVIFLFSTFATIRYVDTKHQSVFSLLKDIKTRIIRIENHILNNKE